MALFTWWHSGWWLPILAMDCSCFWRHFWEKAVPPQQRAGTKFDPLSVVLDPYDYLGLDLWQLLRIWILLPAVVCPGWCQSDLSLIRDLWCTFRSCLAWRWNSIFYGRKRSETGCDVPSRFVDRLFDQCRFCRCRNAAFPWHPVTNDWDRNDRRQSLAVAIGGSLEGKTLAGKIGSDCTDWWMWPIMLVTWSVTPVWWRGCRRKYRLSLQLDH